MFALLPPPKESPADAFGQAKPEARRTQAGAGPSPGPRAAAAPPNAAVADAAQLLQLFLGFLPDDATAAEPAATPPPPPPPAPAHAPAPDPQPAAAGAHQPSSGSLEARTAEIGEPSANNANLLVQAQASPQSEEARRAAAEQQDKIRKSINDGKAVAVAFQLATLSRGMNDANSRAFIDTLDKIDDPDLRHKVMAQFEAQTGQSLHGFIEHCDDWNNNGDNRDKAAALQLIDEKRDKAEEAIAKMSPEEKARKEKEADDAAKQIVAAMTAHDHSDENMQKIFRAMGGREPAEIELLRAKIRLHTHNESNLYQVIDDGTHKGDEDEAIAMLAGDRVASVRAALANEDDPKRLREVVSGLKPAELAELRVGPFKDLALAQIKNPADRAEIEALINGDKAKADAEHLGNLLKPKREGMDEPMDKIGLDNFDRRKPANVLKEFEGMSGEDVKAAAEAWNKAHPERTFEKMLEDRWGDDSDKTEYNRLLAMMHGDKGLDRSLRVQEGMREDDQEEIEGALAHETTDDKALKSQDADTRKKAEAIRAENESFESNNVEADRRSQEWLKDWTGESADAPAVGRSTKDQLTAHYDAEARKDIGGSAGETILGGNAAKQIHADRQQKHNDQVHDDRVGAMELLADGKLSTETEVHRGKGAKEKADALENIHSNEDLEKAKDGYVKKYGKEMLPYTDDDRSDMNANELMIDNIRLYGVKAERPAQVEYLLQLQQYEKQYSASLEMSEAGDAGGGTQRWQRQELAAERDMLKDPKLQAFDHSVTSTANGFPTLVDNPNEPTFDQIDKLLPIKGEKVDDGLKEGVTKRDFNLQDQGLTAANKAEAVAKKRLADRIVKIFSTIAKIAAALTAQPELIALIDIAEGLLEMGIKHQIMGEAYDPGEDAKMLAFTAIADTALMGLSKVGQLKGAASIAEREAISAGEKTAVEMEHAVTGEAKAEALSEGAHLAAGESKAMQGAIEEGTSAEKALSSEAAGAVGERVEQKAASIAEGKALHEGESAAAKGVASEVEQGTLTAGEGAAKEAASPAELAKQIEARWGQYGAAAKMAIQTVGGGIVQGKSPSEILKGLVTGGLGLVLPAHLSEKVQAAIGNETAALKILGEIASFGTDFATNTAINVAGGAEGGDAALDAFIGVGGGRAQKAFGGGGHGGAKEEGHASTREEPTTGATEAGGATRTAEPPAPHAEATPVVGEHEALEMGETGRAVVPADAVDPLPQSARKGDEPPPARKARKGRAARSEDEAATPRPAETTEAAAPPRVEETDGRTPIQERIDATTFERGEGYEAEMAKLREGYQQQEAEARKVSTVTYTDVDQFRDVPGAIPGKTSGFTGKPLFHADGTPFGAKGFTNYDVREFGHGVTAIEVRVHLAGAATPEEMARVKAETLANVDAISNNRKNVVQNSAGEESRLHIEVAFVDDPGQAHATVNVNSGEGRSDQLNWFAGELGIQYAHEILHHVGLGDEYIDERTVRRKDEYSPDVAFDDSVLGYYLMNDPDNPGQMIANPDASLKPRHMDVLSEKINAQRAADGYQLEPEGKAGRKSGRKRQAAEKKPGAHTDGEEVAVLADGTKVATPRKQSLPDDPEAALAHAEQAYDQLSDKEKRDPENPVVRARNDAWTRARAANEPEAAPIDAQAEFEAATATEARRVQAEEAAKAAELRPVPDAEARTEEARSRDQAQRDKDAENAAQRAQIEQDQTELARLRNDQRDLRETSGDTTAVEAEIRELEQRVVENEAAVAARAEAASRAMRGEKEANAARQKASEDEAQQVKERGEAQANAERATEEAARAEDLREQTQAKEASEQAAAQRLEQDRLDAMMPGDRAVHEGLQEAKANLAELDAQFDNLGDAEKKDMVNPVVRDRFAALDRVHGLENPGERSDSRADFEANQAAAAQQKQAAEAKKAPEIRALPDAEARTVEAEKRGQAQREQAARNAAQRDGIVEDEKQLARLRNERQDAGDRDVAKIEAEIHEIEGRLAENQAAVAARAEEASRTYREEAEARQARDEASQQAARAASEEREARARDEQAKEEAARSARLREEAATREARDEATVRQREDDTFNAMSPAEKEVHQNLQAAQARLAELDQALDALPDDQKRDPKNTVVRDRNDALDRVHGLENPEATGLRSHETFEAAVADHTTRQEREERVRRESEVRADPEAAARHARADEELGAASAAARDSAARREAIAADETRLGAMRDDEERVGKALDRAERDGDSFAAEDHEAKLAQLRAERQQLEARIAQVKADENARTEEEVLRHQQQRAEEQARNAAQADRLSRQAAELEERRTRQEAQDKAEADAQQSAEYAKQQQASKLAEEQKEAQIRAGLDEDARVLYDALGVAEKAYAALDAELKEVPADRLPPTDPRVVRMNVLADDIDSLEKAVFPNGRPK